MVFAASKKVEELTLDLYTCPNSYSKRDPTLRLPDDLFTCSSLVRVKLTFANLDPLPPFHLKLLIDLHLNECQLPDDGVEIITANCKILKTLVLSNCNEDRDLKITIAPGSVLSKLIVDDTHNCYTDLKTSINATTIAALKILVCEWFRKYSIDNIPDTVAASLSFKGNHGFYMFAEYRIKMGIARLLEQLQPAKRLHLCTRSIQTVIEMKERNLQFNVTHLELDTRLEYDEILGILLLKACTRLEQLILTIIDFPAQYPIFNRLEYMPDNLHDWTSIDPKPLARLASVAVVEFKNLKGPYQAWDENRFDMERFFQGCEVGLQLVKLLMAYAANLANLSFTTANQQYTLKFRT